MGLSPMAIAPPATLTNRALLSCLDSLQQRRIDRSPNKRITRTTKLRDMNTRKLAGKVAVVTGASKGIGAGIARQFAAEGAAVVVNYASSKADADKIVDEITKRGGKVIAVQANVAKKAEIQRLFAAATKAFGKIDILVNNAGAYEFVPIEKVTEEQFHRLFDVNVLGMLLTIQEALKHFNADGGSIINIGSLAGSLTPPTAVVYNATKAAVDAIRRTLAKELGPPRRIRVNSINPGMVITEGAVAGGYTEGDMRKTFESQTPLGRVGQTQDIAPAAVFLASVDSNWITGETLHRGRTPLTYRVAFSRARACNGLRQ
jgi:3-oxoacyl-[acyl-carrier protein] reductase